MWGEFSVHTGYLLLPIALLGFVVWAWRGRRRDICAVLLAWFVTGAALYSLTDWRQTKHLMNQLAPLETAAVVLAWPSTGLPARGAQPRGLAWVAGVPQEAQMAWTELVAAVTSLASATWAALAVWGLFCAGSAWVAAAALAIALVINMAADLRLVADFSSLNISGASDVDGW